MLILSRKEGQTIIVNTAAGEITVTAIKGDKFKLGITAPQVCGIVREELVELQAANSV